MVLTGVDDELIQALLRLPFREHLLQVCDVLDFIILSTNPTIQGISLSFELDGGGVLQQLLGDVERDVARQL